jgi:hypothetical protein
MRRRVAVGTVAVAIAAAVAVTACSSSGSSSADTSPTTAKKRTGASHSPPRDSYAMLVQGARRKPYKVRYQLATGGDITYAQDGKNSVAYSFAENTVISTKNGVIWCNGLGTRHPACGNVGSIAAVGTGASLDALMSASLQAITDAGGSYASHSTATIAGRPATCVSVAAKDIVGGIGAAIVSVLGSSLAGSLTQCADMQTGALLGESVTAPGGTPRSVLVATAFTASASSDFVPPVSPETLPPLTFTTTTLTLPPGATLPTTSSIPVG